LRSTEDLQSPGYGFVIRPLVIFVAVVMWLEETGDVQSPVIWLMVVVVVAIVMWLEGL
jgi:hypothetical protein